MKIIDERPKQKKIIDIKEEGGDVSYSESVRAK